LVARIGDEARIEEAALAADGGRLPAAEHPSAFAARLLHLGLELGRRVGLGHRAERGGGVEGVAELQLLAHLGERAFQEAIVDGSVDVDTLDAAAALAGVVEATVDEILDRVGKVGVGSDVSRILAPKLETDVDEARRRDRAIDLVAAAHAAR